MINELNRRKGIMSNLGYLRKSRGLTQEKLAAALGLSASTLRNWEQRHSNAPLAKAARIAMYLDVTVDDLLRARGESVEPICCEVPFYSLSRLCGEPPCRPDGSLPLYPHLKAVYPHSFFVEMCDESMSLLFPKDSYLLVDGAADEFENGDIVLAATDQLGVVVRSYLTTDQTMLLSARSHDCTYRDYLSPINTAGPPHNSLIGKIVWWMGGLPE